MMNGVAVIDRVTIDCIYSGFARYPEDGEELLSKDFSMTLGGGACVIPIRLSKMGVPSAYGTFLSDDMLSDTAKTLLKKFGFENIHNFYRGEKSPVIFSTIFSNANDRGILSYDAGDIAAQLSDDEAYSFLKDYDICFAPARSSVVKKLHSEGKTLIYDSHWVEGQTLADYIPIIKYADFFTPNAKEAMALTDTDTPQQALLALCEHTACPIVKTGKDGCIARIGGEIKAFPAARADTVDTTGAGDNFLAGLAFGVYHGLSRERCIEFANLAGSRSTEGIGCFAAEYDLNKYL